MDRFQAMQVFVRVVDVNSFSRAADSLGLPRTTVTNAIQSLEQRLQVRLLNRTTRRISLTPDGAAYYERCVRILADVEETEGLFRDAAGRPRGSLRIDVPASIGKLILLPALCDFHQRYPEVQLVIGMGDRPVDLVEEAVDCALRFGELQDSRLVARRIGTFELLTCASPRYLERFGTPQRIEDLAEHRAVNYFSSRTGRTVDWDFVVDGKSVAVPMRGCISVNDAEAYVMCGVQGVGMIQPPRYMVKQYLESGALVEVLSQWRPSPLPISAVYLQNRHLSPKVRAFVDWVAALFAECPLMKGCPNPPEPCQIPAAPNACTVRRLIEQQNMAETLF